jgi:hypothetical protein
VTRLAHRRATHYGRVRPQRLAYGLRPTFPEIEQPFEVLSILARCRMAMNRPR